MKNLPSGSSALPGVLLQIKTDKVLNISYMGASFSVVMAVQKETFFSRSSSVTSFYQNQWPGVRRNHIYKQNFKANQRIPFLAQISEGHT